MNAPRAAARTSGSPVAAAPPRVSRAAAGAVAGIAAVYEATHPVISAYVQGVAMADDLEEQARQDSGISDGEWMERNEPRYDAIQGGGAYPLLSSLSEGEEFDLDLEPLFEFGLLGTLDGIAVMIGETSG
ncbi:TetR/AcrR family transcriptional regulator C-terminal domain-containing protein [Streptomyces vilmorinianum]|uniref:TetR/AcrR family transcriptional regulator C-terminal domain-containing protein n=1 Tax=Streptomyces vilmorinianum TaxID=3051092 RepID=UPI0010FBB505|nr:TetR/AcrR family transcriptional regulator C-terminal domain-containing protein [Streptomyces vilmorinianum]